MQRLWNIASILIPYRVSKFNGKPLGCWTTETPIVFPLKKMMCFLDPSKDVVQEVLGAWIRARASEMNSPGEFWEAVHLKFVLNSRHNVGYLNNILDVPMLTQNNTKVLSRDYWASTTSSARLKSYYRICLPSSTRTIFDANTDLEWSLLKRLSGKSICFEVSRNEFFNNIRLTLILGQSGSLKITLEPALIPLINGEPVHDSTL
jgi:hypothetical protein